MKHTTHRAGKRRERRPADEIQALISDYRTSRLTQREFAAQNRVSFSTFTSWLRRYRDPEHAEEGNGLIRVTLKDGTAASPDSAEHSVEVVTPSGWRLRFPAGYPSEAAERLISFVASRC